MPQNPYNLRVSTHLQNSFKKTPDDRGIFWSYSDAGSSRQKSLSAASGSRCRYRMGAEHLKMYTPSGVTLRNSQRVKGCRGSNKNTPTSPIFNAMSCPPKRRAIPHHRPHLRMGLDMLANPPSRSSQQPMPAPDSAGG